MCTNDELATQLQTFSAQVLDKMEQAANERAELRKNMYSEIAEVKSEITVTKDKIAEINAWQNQMKGGGRVIVALMAGMGGASALLLGWLEFLKR